MHSSDRADWLIPTLLIALGAVPAAAGWIVNPGTASPADATVPA